MERARHEALAGAASTFDLIYSESERILLHISMDEYIFPLTRVQPTTYSEKMSFVASVSNIVNTLIFHEEYIHSINLYFEENDFFFSTTGDNGSINSISDRSWYDEYLKKRDKVDFWVSNRNTEGHTKQNVVSIYKVITSSAESHSVAIININKSKIDALLRDTIDLSESSFFAFDENGNMIYSITNDKTLPDTEKLSVLISASDDTAIPTRISAGKNDYILSYMKSGHNRWNYASITSLEDYNDRLSALLFFTLACFLFMILIEIVIAFFLSMRMYKPIKRIIDLLDNPEKWVSAANNSLIISANELKYIEQNILSNYHESSQIKTEFENKIVSLKKATVTALQSQMNPHFLYNTLESINWKARRLLGTDNEVSDMLLTLSRILRYNLNSSNNFIALGEEVRHAQIYLSLQSLRYKNLFEAKFDVAEDILEANIVKFLLQPILENAIYHGIKPAGKKCTISVTVKSANELLIITVSDNGVGIDDESLKRLNFDLSENTEHLTKHIGLTNINQRIKLLCGEKYGIAIKSKESKGTSVIVTLPATIAKES